MNRFVEGVKQELNRTFTENGQLAYKSTGTSKALDFFAVAGALRGRSVLDITMKFREAFQEDPLVATILLFHTGDIRQGLGERRTFRICLEWLAENHPEVVMTNMELIPHYNRWDSIFVLKGTLVERDMIKLVSDTLSQDLTATNVLNKKGNFSTVSLLAKWMPSISTSSKETRELAHWFASKLGLSPKQYRQTLSYLRANLKVVETQMSAGEWGEIKYSAVPSVAMSNLHKAFDRHDGARFQTFLENVAAGRETINAGALYPYNIIEKLLHNYDADRTLEEQWKALPNFIEGKNNVLIMADTSGSMFGRPMATAIGLAIYFAERNSGPWKDLFMTFSAEPTFIRLPSGAPLLSKVREAMDANWGFNTNLEKAFEKILKVAVTHGVPAEDMPKALVVISDMEIDSCCSGEDFLTSMRKRFAHCGYELPTIVFWNVDSRKDTFLVNGDPRGITLVSGQATSTFTQVMNSIGKTPMETMMELVQSPRYAGIRLPI